MRPLRVECPHQEVWPMPGCDSGGDGFLPCGCLSRTAAGSACDLINDTAMHETHHSESIATISMAVRCLVVMMEVMGFCLVGCLQRWRQAVLETDQSLRQYIKETTTSSLQPSAWLSGA